jgi:hypothetical protein
MLHLYDFTKERFYIYKYIIHLYTDINFYFYIIYLQR